MALKLPGVEAGKLHGAPSLKVSRRLLACPAIHSSAEPNSIVVSIGLEQRDELIRAKPDVFYLTDHYVKYPMVLVRLGEIDRKSLNDLLSEAWRFVGPKVRKKGLV